jgi:hypothetical protein
MKYACEYRHRGSRKEHVLVVDAKNENDARLKMMKFAEKEDVFVQNIGKEITNEK